jgi:hypothetical protein
MVPFAVGTDRAWVIYDRLKMAFGQREKNHMRIHAFDINDVGVTPSQPQKWSFNPIVHIVPDGRQLTWPENITIMSEIWYVEISDLTRAQPYPNFP